MVAGRGRGRPLGSTKKKAQSNHLEHLPLILSSAPSSSAKKRGRPPKSIAKESKKKNDDQQHPSPVILSGAANLSSSTKKCKKNPQNDRHEHLSQLTPLLASAITAAHNFLVQNDLHLHPSQTLTLESLIASSAVSLTKFNSLVETLVPPETVKSLTPLSSLSSSSCWFQRFLYVASDDSDPRWIEAFRMSKPSFTLLLETLTRSLEDSVSTCSPDYTLGAALFRLAHAASFKSIGRRFGLDSASACRAFYTVCKAVNDQLSHLFDFPSDLGRIIESFGWISLPNCCGVLGFSRFPIDGGALGKKDGAIIAQGLVDGEGRFLDVSAGWPSYMSPDTILRKTKLFQRVEESKELLNGPALELGDGKSAPQYILGDSCFPLLPWLLTPFPESNIDDELSSSQQSFNSAHSRGIELVDKAFGRVKGRWKLLSMRWKEEGMEFLPFVIVTACLLHNFLIKCKESLPNECKDWSMDQKFPVFDGLGNENESGERIRDFLASHLILMTEQR
ncbi:protein ALP1-like [Telopea speciosissima]|uniref:protein ALP1-like n=1 Tax=Telopea speciosissima TaxID=54955 RepID=UPI001CC3DB0F|nr:protein ALP1-like [Telopea speciosissima]